MFHFFPAIYNRMPGSRFMPCKRALDTRDSEHCTIRAHSSWRPHIIPSLVTNVAYMGILHSTEVVGLRKISFVS